MGITRDKRLSRTGPLIIPFQPHNINLHFTEQKRGLIVKVRLSSLQCLLRPNLRLHPKILFPLDLDMWPQKHILNQHLSEMRMVKNRQHRAHLSFEMENTAHRGLAK